MASTNFTYAPTTGSGNAQISVSANTQNVTSADCVANITFSAGTHNTTVTVRQKYCPIMTQIGSSTFPATGGSISFTVNTEYDVSFRSAPGWITIKKGSTTIASGTRVSSGTVNGSTLQLVASENTGGVRSNNSMYMAHYIGDELQTHVDHFSFTQQSAATIVDMRTTPTSVAVGSASTSTTVDILTSGCSFSSMTYTTGGTFVCTATASNNQIVVTYPVNHETTARTGYVYFTLYDTSGNSYESYLSVNQAAGVPIYTWSASNLSNVYVISGNLYTGNTGDYAGLYIGTRDTMAHTEAVPVTITSAYLGLTPTPTSPTLSVKITNLQTRQSITCNNNNGLFIGSGTITLSQGDILAFTTIGE